MLKYLDNTSETASNRVAQTVFIIWYMLYLKLTLYSGAINIEDKPVNIKILY